MPKRVEMWECDLCGEAFQSEEDCLMHEKQEIAVGEANKMLKNGSTLKEINDKLNLWHSIPKHLEDVTKDHCFTISHWQCCDKPAYRITFIAFTGGVYGAAKLNLWGCGSWSGYYGEQLDVTSHLLSNPFPPEELFIDKRYK